LCSGDGDTSFSSVDKLHVAARHRPRPACEWRRNESTDQRGGEVKQGFRSRAYVRDDCYLRTGRQAQSAGVCCIWLA
jgi:hypothetical protein